MKYLIVVPDGAADRPMAQLGGKTPLQIAHLKNINKLAQGGEVGLAKTIPEGIPPGSDAANLAVMGFNPRVYLTGRSPLEAISMGIDMSDTDVAMRTNLVTLEEGAGGSNYEDLIIKDHSAGEISNEEARVLIEEIERKLGTDDLKFYPGISYRHALIAKNGKTDLALTPPHDVLDGRVGDHLPAKDESLFIGELMKKSYDILKDHPINQARKAKGLNPANSIWIWGEGKKPQLKSFYDKYGIKGSVISAVDLIKGIGISAGLKSIDVPGATGTIDTNYEGKAQAAMKEFEEGQDYVYVHVEAPDESSHQGNLEAKIKSLELIDERIVGEIVDYLEKSGQDYRVLVIPDHRTPIEIRTHSEEPVPFVLYDSRKNVNNPENSFDEESAKRGDLFENGYEVADYFFEK